jgi:hypothetical protein
MRKLSIKRNISTSRLRMLHIMSILETLIKLTKPLPHNNQCSMNREGQLRAGIMSKFPMKSLMMLDLSELSSNVGSFLSKSLSWSLREGNSKHKASKTY